MSTYKVSKTCVDSREHSRILSGNFLDNLEPGALRAETLPQTLSDPTEIPPPPLSRDKCGNTPVALCFLCGISAFSKRALHSNVPSSLVPVPFLQISEGKVAVPGTVPLHSLRGTSQ